MGRVNNTERAKWQEHVSAFPQSGLTRAEYCRKHGIATHKLDYWRKQLRDCQRPARPFIALDVQSEPKMQETVARIRIVLPAGIVMELEHLPDPSWVRSLLELGESNALTARV